MIRSARTVGAAAPHVALHLEVDVAGANVHLAREHALHIELLRAEGSVHCVWSCRRHGNEVSGRGAGAEVKKRAVRGGCLREARAVKTSGHGAAAYVYATAQCGGAADSGGRPRAGQRRRRVLGVVRTDDGSTEAAANTVDPFSMEERSGQSRSIVHVRPTFVPRYMYAEQ